MSCPICRSLLVSPTRDAESKDELYCPKCNVHYGRRINLKGLPRGDIGCLDEAKNIFYGMAGDQRLVVKQPRISDLPAIREGLKLASEYTFLRYPSLIWDHPEGICYLPPFMNGGTGTLYLIMVFGERVVGFTHHQYWFLLKETWREWDFPVPVGTKICLAQLCVLDPYQRSGIGSLYAKISEYIAGHNEAEFIMGETYKEGGMLNIRLRDGWTAFGERRADDNTTRILIGRSLK